MSDKTRDDLLQVYLRDHLAGSTAGLALARRLAREHRRTPLGAELRRLADDISDDRASLQHLMSHLGITGSRLKHAAAVIGELLSRLKPNGRLLRRSPLSTVLDLEMMRMGVEGKASGWRTLGEIASTDSRLTTSQLDTLVSRAVDQSERFERLRVQAVSDALRS